MSDFISKNRFWVKTFCLVVLVAMTYITTRASLDKSVIQGYIDVAKDPWGLATLFDAYFGFLFFYLYILSEEPRITARILWFLGLMVLGNFVMAFYVLLKLRTKHLNPLQ